MNGYQDIITEFKVSSLIELKSLFDEQISNEWIHFYAQDCHGLTGDITTQRFFDYTFVYDSTAGRVDRQTAACAIPDGRVIGVYGISNADVNKGNRNIMKKGPGKAGVYDCLGGKYDRGHFIAHLSGGPIDINLFPQRRDLNRGWSAEGKRFRAMERFIASNPGIFVFSLAIYSDFSCRPSQIQFGYCDGNLRFVVEKFSNLYP